jgi:RNA polymerase sigma-70 factor, ECF subfamily
MLSAQEFTLLINRYLRSVYGFVYRYAGNTQDAEDIAQEVFVKVWRNFHKFNPKKGKLKTWIFTIAKNTALDFLRKSRAASGGKRSTPLSQFENEEGHNPILDSLEDIELLPNELFEQRELGEMLSHAMEEISPAYRMVLFLHYNDGFTFQEIAEILEEPLNTVKSRNRRGLLMLRKYLMNNRQFFNL